MKKTIFKAALALVATCLSSNALMADSVLKLTTGEPTNYFANIAANWDWNNAFDIKVNGGTGQKNILNWSIPYGLILQKDGGNVGIGTTTPYAKLDVTGNIYLTKHASTNMSDASERGEFFIGSKSGNTGDGFAGMKIAVIGGTAGCGNGARIYFRTWGCEISSSRDIMTLNEWGNVGIGTSIPAKTLDVAGKLFLFSGRNGNPTLKFNNTGMDMARIGGTAASGIGIWGTANVETDNTPTMLVKGSNVGIGNTAPQCALTVGTDNASTTSLQLDVKGSAHFNNDLGTTTATMTKVSINTDTYVPGCALTVAGPTYIGDWNTIESSTVNADYIGTYNLWVDKGVVSPDFVLSDVSEWADDVFEPEYNLPTLKEVEQYVSENGHLHGVPSAKEVKENGYSVAKLNTTLLRKVEELTVYAIAMEKKASNLQQQLDELNELKNELKELKTSLQK